MSLGLVWFDFFVNQWIGIELAIVVTLLLYYFILLIGRVSYQMQIQILMPAFIYFATLLWPTKLALYLGLVLAICYAGFQIYRTVGREQ